MKLLVEGLACRPQRVAQLWLPNLPKKFKEVVSRLQKREETKSLVGGVVMAEDSLQQEECFALASKVATMYKVSGYLVDIWMKIFLRCSQMWAVWWPPTLCMNTTRLGRW